jgi:hypothetical protein
MNRMERNFGASGEAKLKYNSGDFDMIVHGAYVICAVTGKRIMLEELRYWNADLQEAYVDAATSLKRHKEVGQTP